MLRKRPEVRDLDPKAVTNDELFGIINPATREWKDGLFRSDVRIDGRRGTLLGQRKMEGRIRPVQQLGGKCT